MTKMSQNLIQRMQKNADLAEKCFQQTAEEAQKHGWMVGPLTDAAEGVTRQADRQITLTFSVMAAGTGEVLSKQGQCRITLDGEERAKRVHAYFETSEGEVKDIFVNTQIELDQEEGEDGEGMDKGTGGGRRKRRHENVVDAEIVNKKD
jgi:hypothetical protein